MSRGFRKKSPGRNRDAPRMRLPRERRLKIIHTQCGTPPAMQNQYSTPKQKSQGLFLKKWPSRPERRFL
nr:MAG TPA: hypothetical protein [Caudoviricetes sp.]